ncbi:uncharacterized protein [Aristolochia californica]|uniref:uncharacterized protein n=1 Tax=Aristolochia californica TaxID=171875 RepID=UPI0035E108C7
MEWRKSYLDLILVPLGFILSLVYHAWLWHRVRTRPMSTIIGTNASGRRLWVIAMMKDNDKKNVLAVQTLRNAIMGSTLMATTSILLSSGLAALISSTYSIKKPLNDSVYGAHGELMVALKYVTLLLIFLFSFVCYSLSIRFINQVNFLINTPQVDSFSVSPEYVAELLEKGFILNTVGNRLFYAALPLLLWIFGPILVFLCSVTMIPVLYNLDVVFRNGKGMIGEKVQETGEAFDAILFLLTFLVVVMSANRYHLQTTEENRLHFAGFCWPLSFLLIKGSVFIDVKKANTWLWLTRVPMEASVVVPENEHDKSAASWKCACNVCTMRTQEIVSHKHYRFKPTRLASVLLTCMDFALAVMELDFGQCLVHNN